MTTNSDSPVITHAEGSYAYTPDGHRLIDLINGYGAVFLGHGHHLVIARLQDQVSRLWTGGRCTSPALADAEAMIRRFLPAGLKPAGIYSTGMEVAEFAMRLAAAHTGKNEFVGFARSMHGKSTLTAALCWDNALIGSDRAHVLPFVHQASEDDILQRLADVLDGGRIAGIFVEPVQGSNGGHEASLSFYHQVITLCREHGILCIFDEILMGLHRTGPVFWSDRLAEQPDMLLFAKSMGNGFPVSSIAVREDLDILPQALPGSTFSGNPLAAAAVASTLEAMGALPMVRLVADIENTVITAMANCEDAGITLRGCGAFWALELSPRVQMDRALYSIRDEGLLVSCYDRYIRLLPAATIDLRDLHDACISVVRACSAAYI